MERCLARFQRFGILINNAGVIIKKPFAEITDQDFERSFAINARSPFLLMRTAAVHMREEGRIINIGTSILGCSFPFYGIYAASKAALEHMSRALAKELASRRISVNTVAPGALDTAFFFRGRDARVRGSHKAFYRWSRPARGCRAARRVLTPAERDVDVRLSACSSLTQVSRAWAFALYRSPKRRDQPTYADVVEKFDVLSGTETLGLQRSILLSVADDRDVDVQFDRRWRRALQRLRADGHE